MPFTENSEMSKGRVFGKFRDATLFLLLWDFESEYTETERLNDSFRLELLDHETAF